MVLAKVIKVPVNCLGSPAGGIHFSLGVSDSQEFIWYL